MWHDIFPEIRFDDWPPRRQIGKVLDELCEAEEALDSERFGEEMLDVINAAFNALYKAGYSDTQISEMQEHIRRKNYARGYYHGHQDI